MSYIEITTKSGKNIVVGSLYRLPNSSNSVLLDHIEHIIAKVKLEKNHKQLILGMDHNFDLLKCNQHRPTKRFLDKMMDLNMLPAITRPTRFISNTATLIDNIFISKLLQRNFDSGLIVDDISDHLPSIVLMKQTRLTDKSPIEFDSRNLTDDKISRIKSELMCIDWNGTLNNDDCSVNFENFCTKLNMIMDNIAPIKHIRISGKRRFVEPWMSTSLEIASRNNKKLYPEALKIDCLISTVEKYKTSRNLLNRLKRSAMKKYYATKCTEYRDNTTKLWQVINQTIGKTKNGGSIIPFISIEGIKTYDAKRISNEFGKFYANLGRNLASQISPGMRTVDDYLTNIPRTPNSIVLKLTTQLEIEQKIDDLAPKTSCGHDRVSNKFIKKLKSSISYPLTIIFNQSIISGHFPNMMKIAEIIPLYKGKEWDEVVNYRPISLLMTISKLLEKIIYTHVYSFLEEHNILYDSQYGF